MRHTKSFIAFLESIRPYNPHLIEAVLSGFHVCIESEDDTIDDESAASAAGDGNEKIITVPERLGFKVEGNRMTCEFLAPVEDGIESAPKSLEDIKRKMAKVGLGFEYSIKPIDKVTIESNLYVRYSTEATFTAPEYKKDGYDYVMSMENTEGGTIIIPAPEHRSEDFSAFYKTTGFVCDHCHSDRLRNVMHVFRKDGKNYTYGTSCAKKYFGINFLDKISRAIYYMFHEFEKFASDGGGARNGISASYLFEFAFGYFKKYPLYRKESQRADGSIAASTGKIIISVFNNSAGKQSSERNEIISAIPSDIASKYSEFKKYYVNLDAKSEFENNMAVMANTSSLENRVGVFLYAVYNWMKVTGDVPSNKPTLEPRAESNYVGNVGDKMLFTAVRVIKIIPTETQYGTSYIHIMDSLGDTMSIDAAKALVKTGESLPNAPSGKNDNLVWFASSMSELNEGGTYALTGTVTKHNIRNDRKSGDVKQTIIKLVKVADFAPKRKATAAEARSEIMAQIEPVIDKFFADHVGKYNYAHEAHVACHSAMNHPHDKINPDELADATFDAMYQEYVASVIKYARTHFAKSNLYKKYAEIFTDRMMAVADSEKAIYRDSLAAVIKTENSRDLDAEANAEAKANAKAIRDGRESILYTIKRRMTRRAYRILHPMDIYRLLMPTYKALSAQGDDIESIRENMLNNMDAIIARSLRDMCPTMFEKYYDPDGDISFDYDRFIRYYRDGETEDQAREMICGVIYDTLIEQLNKPGVKDKLHSAGVEWINSTCDKANS